MASPHLTSQKLLPGINDRQEKRGSASFEKLLPLETGPLLAPTGHYLCGPPYHPMVCIYSISFNPFFHFYLFLFYGYPSLSVTHSTVPALPSSNHTCKSSCQIAFMSNCLLWLSFSFVKKKRKTWWFHWGSYKIFNLRRHLWHITFQEK